MLNLELRPANREDPQADEGPYAGPSAARRSPPWPEGHEPLTDGERRLWESFEDLRLDENAKLSQELVATRIGMSRTPISQRGTGFKLLRSAIRAEIGRRSDELKARTKSEQEPPSPAQREQERLARREIGVNYWKAIAQRSDSAVIAAEARAVRAEIGQRKAATLLRRMLSDVKAGRWAVADEAAEAIADAEAFVAMPTRDDEGSFAGISDASRSV